MSLEQSLLREKDACTILGISRATLWRRVKDGTIPQPVKIGGATRFPSSEILHVIEVAMAQRGDP